MWINDLFDKRIRVLYIKGLDGPKEFLSRQKYIFKKSSNWPPRCSLIFFYWSWAGASTGKISGRANTSHSSQISGYYTEFGKIGKIVLEMLRILEKMPQKGYKYGNFNEILLFFPQKGPNFTFFPVKVPYFTIFVDPVFPKPSQWEVCEANGGGEGQGGGGWRLGGIFLEKCLKLPKYQPAKFGEASSMGTS